MPRRSIRTNAGRSTRRRQRFGRKRSNAMAKMRYGRTNARAQQGYILRNARLVNRLNRQYQSGRVFTDWKYDVLGVPTTGQWYIRALTDMSAYTQCLRQNQVADNASHTFIKRLQLTCVTTLRNSPALFVNAFLVRPRYPSGNRDFVGPNAPVPELVNNDDYIWNSNRPGEMLQFNPSVFKVLAKQQFRLMTNNIALPQNPALGTEPVGDVSHISKRWVWNLNINMKVASPNAGQWQKVPFDTMPYYNKVYLVMYVQAGDNTAGDGVSFTAEARFTAINHE